MNRVIRIVSLMRWTAVGMHTALIVSTTLLFATVGSKIDARFAVNVVAIMVLDSPALVLDIPICLLIWSVCPSAAGSVAVWSVTNVLLGGLQWYLIVSLVAWRTCGCERTILLATKRFGAAVILGALLIGGCGIMPWHEHIADRLHRRIEGTQPRPIAAFAGEGTMTFAGESGLLKESVVVPALDTPVADGKNVIWCASFQLA